MIFHVDLNLVSVTSIVNCLYFSWSPFILFYTGDV